LSKKTASVQSEVIHLKDVALEQNLFLSSLPTSWPVRGYIGSPFGMRTDPISGGREFHEGIDISAPYGCQVNSPADGVVIFAGVQRGYGYCIVVAHKYGITTRYAHLSGFSVKTGQRVKKNEILGFIGNTGKATGPHLHFEVHVNGQPVNPLRFLSGSSNS
jgi:murein DD-endopeptidase MepM/ murein hydrolase activator NlpD